MALPKVAFQDLLDNSPQPMPKEQRMPRGGASCDGFREANSETGGGHEGDREGALPSRVADIDYGRETLQVSSSFQNWWIEWE